MIFKSKAWYTFLILPGIIGCSDPIDVSGDNQVSSSGPTLIPYIDQFIPTSTQSDQGALDMESGNEQVDMTLPRPTPLECAEEECDALDNDCDGSVDEGLGCTCNEQTTCYGGPPHTRGIGECRDGSRMCEGENWGECEGWQSSQDESCDGLDNDCDHQIDEGVSNACGQCGDVPEESCDGVDNDCDGQTDEGVLNACGTCGEVPEETCDEMDNDCDGQIDEGVLNACGFCGAPPEEVCDEMDNDCDGQIDEDASNACGACDIIPNEVCDLIDNDCDGRIDENVCVIADLNIDGDCVTAECPMSAPHPIACEINFDGGDPRGCVAHRPGESEIYLQEGNNCGAGRVSGTLTCSTIQGMGLDESTCPINKSERFYVRNRSGCPDTN